MSDGYTLKIAQSTKEIEMIRRYSDRVFKEDGVTVAGIDDTDLMPDTKIFYAYKQIPGCRHPDICGTIRYTLDSENGLPIDRAVYLPDHAQKNVPKNRQPVNTPQLTIDITALRRGRPFDRRLVNFGMLAIDSEHRVTARIYEILMKLCVVHSIKNGAKKAIITVNHAIEKTMERFGFTRFFPERLYSPSIRNCIVVMSADLTLPFFSRLDIKLPENVSIFAGSQVFRIYARNSLICRQDDPLDKKVFLVVSGSVRIEVEKNRERKRIALIGPGEIFGEMALIDNQPRSADVICNHRHVILQELTNLDKDTISRTPEIFFEFAAMLSRRIRALNEKVKQSASFTPEKCIPAPIPETLRNYIAEKESTIFPKSKQICRQGDQSDGMYLINRGEIAITIELSGGGELLLGFAREGALVGEMALIEGEKRSATMTACELVTAVEINKADLIQLIRSDWRVGHFMLRTIVQKLRVTDKMIAGSIMIRRNLETDFKQKLLSISEQETLMDAIHEVFHHLDPKPEKTTYDLQWIGDELGVPQNKIRPWMEQLAQCKAVRTNPESGAVEVLDAALIEQTKLFYDLTV